MINKSPSQILLASRSPRRKRLLGLLTSEFIVQNIDTEEHLFGPIDEALVRIVRKKIIASKFTGTAIAADTVLLLDDEVLAKPIDRPDAISMLERLSLQSPEVLTAVVVRTADDVYLHEIVRTRLHLRQLSRSEINLYVATGAADDKAGSLDVQAQAADFVKEIDGCRANVYGLPLCATSRLLIKSSIKVRQHGPQDCCERDDLEEYLRDES